MSSTQWTSLLNAGQYNQTQPGVAYANANTLTDVSPGAVVPGQAFVIQAGELQEGNQLQVYCAGNLSTSGTPNLTLGLYWGGTAGTALATTGVLPTASSLSNATWSLNAYIRVESTGASGSMRVHGWVLGPYGNEVLLPAAGSNGNLVTPTDTSTAQFLTVGATWGTASTSNTLTAYQFLVWSHQF